MQNWRTRDISDNRRADFVLLPSGKPNTKCAFFSDCSAQIKLKLIGSKAEFVGFDESILRFNKIVKN